MNVSAGVIFMRQDTANGANVRLGRFRQWQWRRGLRPRMKLDLVRTPRPALQIARGIVSGLAIARCERRSARSVAALAVD